MSHTTAIAAIDLVLVTILLAAVRLDHDPTADNVQPASKPQRRGNLRLAVAGLGDLDGRELRLHQCGHGHW